MIIEMAECSLGYNELLEKIREHKCVEYERLKNSELNKYAVFFRNGGITYCYGLDCPHRRRHKVTIEMSEQKFSLELTDKEREYLKKRRWDFLLDEVYVDKHAFYPDDRGGYYGNIPILPPTEIEEGDIMIFFDYDERNEPEFQTDRFIEATIEDRGTYPHAIIVKSPQNLKKR